jgi:hypothetical protein
MALNPSIILAGQQFDLAGSMGAGNQLAAQTNQLRDQNALRQVYQTQGAGILAGEQPALNALAAVDPNLAINAQGGVLQNQTATRQLEVLNAQEKRAIADAARNMDEAQKAQAAAAVKQEVLQFIAAPTPEIFDQMVTQAGKPELAGMWANRQVLGAQYVSSVEEALKLSQGPAKPVPLSSAGKFFADQEAGFIPAGTPPPTSGPVVNVNTGENSSAFIKKADETAATRLGSIVEAGQSAQAFMGDLTALARLAGQINTGKGAQVMATLGPYVEALGFSVEGLSEAEAFEGIKDRLVPQMRPPGSGAASDFDARQFLSSLPSLARTPEGNQIINNTLQALYQHRMAASEIASRAFNGELTWQQADAEIAKLGNPYDTFNASKGEIDGDAATADFSQMDMNGLAAVDVMTLDAAGLDAFEARMNQLTGGN